MEKLRERRAIYLELLWTVGLFSLPAVARAVLLTLHGEEAAGLREHPEWAFGLWALDQVLLIGLLFHVIRLNGENLAAFARAWTGRLGRRSLSRRFQARS